MGIIFFGIFSTVGIFMRIFGRDELRLKLEQKRTYWIEKANKKSDVSCYSNQF